MLTKRQLQLFEFIDKEITRTGGASPSFDEIKDHLRLKSKSGVSRLLDALEGRGFIRREKHIKRAITILRRPDERHAVADAQFATIPDDPADIAAEVDALHVLISARLNVLDKLTITGTTEVADLVPDYSKHGTSLQF